MRSSENGWVCVSQVLVKALRGHESTYQQIEVVKRLGPAEKNFCGSISTGSPFDERPLLAQSSHSRREGPQTAQSWRPRPEAVMPAQRQLNSILAAQERLLVAWNKTVTEEPPGEKQIDYHENSDQWVPRGDVLRCIIDDGGPEGEVTIHIDDKELSLAEFGRMLTVHAGWGMRIALVPEEFVSENPKVEIRKPKRRKR